MLRVPRIEAKGTGDICRRTKLEHI